MTLLLAAGAVWALTCAIGLTLLMSAGDGDEALARALEPHDE